MDFPKGDSTFYDFPEAQAGASGALDPPETNPLGTTILSPRPNFNFGANMASN